MLFQEAPLIEQLSNRATREIFSSFTNGFSFCALLIQYKNLVFRESKSSVDFHAKKRSFFYLL